MRVSHYFVRVFIAALCGVAIGASAQVGDAAAGRQPYIDNCAACHGLPPDSDARRAANSPAVLSNAINSVNTMFILRGLLTQTQINNIAAFIANPNATATFPLSVSRQGTGNGTVTSTPFGISCGSNCTSNFNSGTLVMLMAEAGNGSTFVGWGGACAAETINMCHVTMDAAKSATVTFNTVAVQNFTLSVSLTGAAAGRVTSSPAGIDCGSACSANYSAGTVVTLTAVPPAGSVFTGWNLCTGTGTCAVTMSSARNVTANFAPIDYSDMWWAGENENGWGMAITQHSPSNAQFNAFYVYEGSATPAPATWYVMPGGAWSNNFTVYTGDLYRPTGSRLDNFVSANVVAGGPVGRATITYTSATTAVLSYTINGVSGTKNILRQPFGPADNSPGLQVGDLWWGDTAQNGWGFSIAQQSRTLFGVWYTYGTTCTGNNAGCQATWYVMPGGTWGTGSTAAANTYTGKIYATTAAPWLGVPFNRPTINVTEVGTVSIAFTPDTVGATTGLASRGVLTYNFTAGPYAGTSQSKPILRQPF